MKNMEPAEGYNMITRNAVRSVCHLKGEPIGVLRVVWKDKDGKLLVHIRDRWAEVYKKHGRYYEVGLDID